MDLLHIAMNYDKTNEKKTEQNCSYLQNNRSLSEINYIIHGFLLIIQLYCGSQ